MGVENTSSELVGLDWHPVPATVLGKTPCLPGLFFL